VIKLQDVSYVRLGTADLDGATKFATDYLGLEISHCSKDAVYLKSDQREHTLCYFHGSPADQVAAFVSAFYKTLKWIATATTDEIVNTVPHEYFLGDREIYLKALKANLLVYSKTGLITRQGMNSALNMLATFDPELKGTKIDVEKTFDDRFVKKATVLLEDSNNAELETHDRRPEVDLETIRD
jgi:ABC-type nitrate/sulfonate/bicarbonate transport system substrate-binding protein